jgi:parallel beta-helix repeat protein
VLTSPYTSAPAGAVVVASGDNSSLTGDGALAANTTYWFAPGTHTLGTGEYANLNPATGDSFLGAPGAILSGQSDNDSAFDNTASGVTIEYLAVENFTAPEGQMVVNHDGGANWTIKYNTVENNAGAGVGVGSGDVVSYNCLTGNQEYGFSSFGGASNVTVSNNEVSFNDGSGAGGGMYDQPSSANPYCGCAGGGKFWNTINATVTGNYIHDNGDPGIWVDTDNAGFNISNNYISNNYAEGITYEISYNFEIENNTLVDNAWGEGPNLGGFPDSAIYINASGGDSRVASNFAGQALIQGNVFTDNWGGVVVYENADRACGLGSDNLCTLLDPTVYTLSSCAANLPAATPSGNPDYFDNCRWKAQNVDVEDNTFNFTPSNIGSDCTTASFCGFNGLFSNYGTQAPFAAWVVVKDLQTQHDVFSDNTYNGPWQFAPVNQGDVVTWAQWTAGYADPNGSGVTSVAQDTGSTFNP